MGIQVDRSRVVDDLSPDDSGTCTARPREIKGRCSTSRISPVPIADRDYQALLIFLENSTRTRESFATPPSSTVAA